MGRTMTFRTIPVLFMQISLIILVSVDIRRTRNFIMTFSRRFFLREALLQARAARDKSEKRCHFLYAAISKTLPARIFAFERNESKEIEGFI
jgi:hypothetical protein